MEQWAAIRPAKAPLRPLDTRRTNSAWRKRKPMSPPCLLDVWGMTRRRSGPCRPSRVFVDGQASRFGGCARRLHSLGHPLGMDAHTLYLAATVLVFGVAPIFSMLGLGGGMLDVPLFKWLELPLKTVAMPLCLLLNGVTTPYPVSPPMRRQGASTRSSPTDRGSRDRRVPIGGLVHGAAGQAGLGHVSLWDPAAPDGRQTAGSPDLI